MQPASQSIYPPTPTIIPLARCYIHQILCESTLDRINGHIIVIQHNQQVVLVHRGVIQPLKGQPTRHRTITYHCHHSPSTIYRRSPSTIYSRLGGDLIPYLYPQCGRYTIASMTRDKSIILTLCWSREGG